MVRFVLSWVYIGHIHPLPTPLLQAAVASSKYKWVSEWNWLLYVTYNDISVIYVTAHRCAGGLKKELDLRSGSQRHRHFVRFLNLPVQASTRGNPLYGDFGKTLHFSRLLRHAWGYGVHVHILTLRYPMYNRVFLHSAWIISIVKYSKFYAW